MLLFGPVSQKSIIKVIYLEARLIKYPKKSTVTSLIEKRIGQYLGPIRQFCVDAFCWVSTLSHHPDHLFDKATLPWH